MNMMVEKFLKYIRYELNHSVHTVLSYSTDLTQFLDFLKVSEEEFSPATVTPEDVRAWVYELTNRKMAVASVRRKVQSLRTFYRWLQRASLVEVNPTEDIPMVKLPSRLPVFVREKSMDKLLDSYYDASDFEAVRNRLIIEMLYETGMRRAELIDLKDTNVDVDSGEMKVLGKRNKERIIPFGNNLAEQIKAYRQMRSKVGPEVENFFITEKGRPLYPSLIYKVVTVSLSTVTSSKRSPHVLRHTFASAMLNNGAELNSVKELLGHESLAATQVYTHITYRELKQNYKHAHPRALKKGG